MKTENMEELQRQGRRSVWIGLTVVVGVIVVVGLIGIVSLRPEPETLSGEVFAAEYRVSGKVPGRIVDIYVEEGQKVKAGDTLVY
ncbi:MAG: biotin/lipoyl-binding protein, partial [Bacteroidales bacterium]|nr:biotin/lipoyl-binding protein [Bacteroidales bacterium]